MLRRGGDAELDVPRRYGNARFVLAANDQPAGIVPDLSSHPVAVLHRVGVSVTISTDDRTVTGTTLTDEMARTAAATGLTPDELAAIAMNGFERAFVPARVMAPIRAEAARAWDAWRIGNAIS